MDQNLFDKVSKIREKMARGQKPTKAELQELAHYAPFVIREMKDADEAGEHLNDFLMLLQEKYGASTTLTALMMCFDGALKHIVEDRNQEELNGFLDALVIAFRRHGIESQFLTKTVELKKGE